MRKKRNKSEEKDEDDEEAGADANDEIPSFFKLLSL